MFTHNGFYLEPRRNENLSFSEISDEQGDLRGCPGGNEQFSYATYQCLHSDPTFIPTDYSPTTAQPTPLLPIGIPTGATAALPTSTLYPAGCSFDKEFGGSYTTVPRVWGEAGEACSNYAGTSNHDYLSTDMTQGCGCLPGSLGNSNHSASEPLAWSDLPLQPLPMLERQEQQLHQQHSVIDLGEAIRQERPRKPVTDTRTSKTAFPFTPASGSELALCPGFPQACVGEYQSDAETKPPFSYITLIASAIMSAKDQRATLSEIYAWIMLHFAYYRRNIRRWQNSIRHALSFNDCFTRVPRPSGETGKGSYWTLHSGALGMFENGSSIRRNRKFVDESRVRRTHTVGGLRNPAGGKLPVPITEQTTGSKLTALPVVDLEDSINAGERTFCATKNVSSLFNQDIPESPQPGTITYSRIMPAITDISDLQMK